MGASSTALFSDDVACDVRDEFVEMYSAGSNATEVTTALIRSWSDSIQDVDDGPIFWLALAATQWKYGCLGEEVRTHAIEIIDDDADLKRWEGSGVGVDPFSRTGLGLNPFSRIRSSGTPCFSAMRPGELGLFK